jgi:thioredoxin-like negative regulator of GroEL
MESVLAQVARKERRRLDVVRVDIEEQADLASRLRVNATPTLVLVVDKRVVGRLAGRASGARIASFLGAYLGVGAAS